MAVVQRVLQGGRDDKVIVIHTTITDADVTNQIIFDNSAFANNPLLGKFMCYAISGSDSLVQLSWDQTTDSSIVAVNPINSPKLKMFSFGGIPNPKGAGATGDILCTTTGLTAGSVVTIIIRVDQV